MASELKVRWVFQHRTGVKGLADLISLDAAESVVQIPSLV